MKTISEVLANAQRAEAAAAAFYDEMVTRAPTPRVKALFEQLAAQEREHEARLARLAASLGATAQQGGGSAPMIEVVETEPDWIYAEHIELDQAFAMALEAEQRAAALYDALADHCPPEAAEVLRSLSRMEKAHASRVEKEMGRARADGAI